MFEKRGHFGAREKVEMVAIRVFGLIVKFPKIERMNRVNSLTVNMCEEDSVLWSI